MKLIDGISVQNNMKWKHPASEREIVRIRTFFSPYMCFLNNYTKVSPQAFWTTLRTLEVLLRTLQKSVEILF